VDRRFRQQTVLSRQRWGAKDAREWKETHGYKVQSVLDAQIDVGPQNAQREGKIDGEEVKEEEENDPKQIVPVDSPIGVPWKAAQFQRSAARRKQ
jgi:hypothetical protein